MPKKAEFILLAAILAVCAISAVCLFTIPSKGHIAVIKCGTEVCARLPLDTDAGFKLEHNTVRIKDGQVYMETADCPDGICIAHAPITKTGETVVCLPNRVIIEVMA